MIDILVSVKTFLRDDQLFRCVDSLLKTYPDLKVVICDDGHQNETKKRYYKSLTDAGHKVLILSFNSGMTKGRNHIVKNSESKYLLYVDDDFIFSESVNIEALIDVLENEKKVGMVAGRVRNNGIVDDYQGFLEIKEESLIQKPLKMSDWLQTSKGTRYKFCDIAFNFYLIRREVFQNVEYDENVKIGCAHSDFFMTVKKSGWKIAFTPDSVIDHEHDFLKKKNSEYEKHRRVMDGYRYFAKKWQIKKIVYFDGAIFDLENLKIIPKPKYSLKRVFTKIKNFYER